MQINKVKCYGFYINPKNLDYEYKKILKKLKEYGIPSTGNKEIDRTRLRSKEFEKIQENNCIDPEMITISADEQMKILTEIKKNNFEKDSKYQQPDFKGQQILGEQLMLAIEMKNQKQIS